MVGPCAQLFLLMFCLSGIILNHRELVRDMEISRKWLPARYEYTKWNGGLLRGTLSYSDSDSIQRVLVYGTGGIWQTDTAFSTFTDFNLGLPSGADYRQISTAIQAGSMYRFQQADCSVCRVSLSWMW